MDMFTPNIEYIASPILQSTSEIHNNVKTRMPTIIIGSLTLIAGLAWNDAFKALIDYYVPEKYKNKTNAWFKLFYAFILTVIIIIAISIVLKFT